MVADSFWSAAGTNKVTVDGGSGPAICRALNPANCVALPGVVVVTSGGANACRIVVSTSPTYREVADFHYLDSSATLTWDTTANKAPANRMLSGVHPLTGVSMYVCRVANATAPGGYYVGGQTTNPADTSQNSPCQYSNGASNTGVPYSATYQVLGS
jgi:hypothetical protein